MADEEWELSLTAMRKDEQEREALLCALNTRVTELILAAEAVDANQDQAAAVFAWTDVSACEEEIAALLPADNPEGAIARRGALRAAFLAGDGNRYFVLKERYIKETNSPELRQRLNVIVASDACRATVRWSEPSVHICNRCGSKL